MTPKRIVVTGGTGFVGRTVLARAAARWPEARLVVPTRHVAAGSPVQLLPNVDLVACNLHDPSALGPLLAGADALVHLVAILHGDAAAFERVHVALPRTLARACRDAGVPRVVHISALAVAPDAPSAYLRSKAAGEAAWRDSGLAVTVLRPSVIFGVEDRFTNLFASLQRVFPVMPLAGADARFQPVWVGDVAAAVIACLERPELAGQVVDCAGPQVMTLSEIIHAVGRMAGCERPVLGLPEALGMLQATLMSCLPGEAPMSRDNLLSMRVPSVASGRAMTLQDLGIDPAPLGLLASHFASRRR
ncbi:complex I NDUFA9 subunit family protein [Ideonella sp. A 288]|uniref:complex I NDUFA9 subunit family protein n=1 Tax=Ideonella sp. A 288 TaxID=1962181 RepID=UPI000B4BED9C|nr:complex I NDUFA9 subunit family protein [Ideonella sp. A 288]